MYGFGVVEISGTIAGIVFVIGVLVVFAISIRRAVKSGIRIDLYHHKEDDDAPE